jgi:predicted MFS family arabinose efflux permease
MTADAPARAARRAVTVIFLFNGLLFGAWATRIPAVKGRLELSDGELGLALGLVAVGALLAMPLSGWLSARGGSRRTTRLAFVCFCVALPLPVLAPTYGLLMVGTLLAGAAGGGLDVAMNAHGVAVEQRHPRPILSSFHAAFSLGGLFGALTGALAAGLDIDVRVHVTALAVLALGLGLSQTRHLLPADADHAGKEAGPLLALPPRALWAVGAVAFCSLIAEGAAADWSAVYVRESLEATASVAALSFVAFSATMTLGRMIGDRLTSIWGPVALVRGGGLLSAVGVGGALVIGHPVAALVGFACLGAGLAVMVPVVFRAGAQLPGVTSGIGIAAVSTMGYSGFLLGPPVIGGVAELTSLPLALGLLVLLGLVIAALAPKVRPASERSEAHAAQSLRSAA